MILIAKATTISSTVRTPDSNFIIASRIVDLHYGGRKSHSIPLISSKLLSFIDKGCVRFRTALVLTRERKIVCSPFIPRGGYELDLRR
jgi:hypothetical protein